MATSSTDSQPRGPPRGFPGDALQLPPVGEPSRAAACFANQVFVDSPAAGLLWGPGEARGQGGGVDNGDVRSETAGDGHSGNRPADTAGGRGGAMPRTLGVSARDVRVEFPYQVSVCSGDMEYEDVVRWLRRFRSSVQDDEGAVRCGRAELSGGDHGGGTDAGGRAGGPMTSGFVGSDAGKGQSSVEGSHEGRRNSEIGPRHDSLENALGDSGLGPEVGPRAIQRGAPWSCQYVEAREFDLTVATAAGGGTDGGRGLLPDLCCAISGISVSMAGYAPNVAGVSGSSGRRGVTRSQPAGLSTSHERSEGVTETWSWRDRGKEALLGRQVAFAVADAGADDVDEICHSSGLAAAGCEADAGVAGRNSEMKCSGAVAGAAGRRAARESARRKRDGGGLSAPMSVTLGGTRHCSSTRKR